MNEHLRIVRGSPTDEEARAIEAAIRKLTLDAEREAARARGIDAWVLSARADATNSARLPRGVDAWKRTGRLQRVPVSDNNVGRGDAR